MVYTAKCFSEVTKYTTNFFYLFKASIISLIKLKFAAIVDEFVLKPNCSSTDILLLIKCWYIINYKTFSKTLENEGKKRYRSIIRHITPISILKYWFNYNTLECVNIILWNINSRG